MTRKSFQLTASAAAGRKKGTPRRRASRVTSIQVDPRVWATALRLAGGDRSRIVVESETSVIVLNPREDR